MSMCGKLKTHRTEANHLSAEKFLTILHREQFQWIATIYERNFVQNSLNFRNI